MDTPATASRLRAVRMQIRRGVDAIKIMKTGGVNSRIGPGSGRQMFDGEAKVLIETAHLYGKKVAVHAHGADGINVALRNGALNRRSGFSEARLDKGAPVEATISAGGGTNEEKNRVSAHPRTRATHGENHACLVALMRNANNNSGA